MENIIAPKTRRRWLRWASVTLDANPPAKRPCTLTLQDLEKLLDFPVRNLVEANRREYAALAELNKKNEDFWRTRK
jgi:hypothetical protein